MMLQVAMLRLVHSRPQMSHMQASSTSIFLKFWHAGSVLEKATIALHNSTAQECLVPENAIAFYLMTIYGLHTKLR